MSQVPIFDADNHMYETREAFTKFLPGKYKGAIQYVDVGGRTKIAVRGQISDYIPNPTFDVVARPGAQEEYFRQGNAEGKSRREIYGEPIRAIPAFREPEPRLEMMDELGVDRTILYPTLASLLEERMRDDPELTHAAIHALNEWMYETWTFNFKERIFATPIITLPIVERAIEELEWVLERGARAVLIRPAPVPGYRGSRSFAKPEFDPFWAKVVEADILVVMHGSDSGYARYVNDWTGADAEMQPFKSGAPSAFRLIQATRPAEDTVSSLLCEGVLSRFPALKIAVVELGSRWMFDLVERFKDVYKKVPQDFEENPIDVIKRNIHICGFWEEDFGALADVIGDTQVLFGSDWPHPEGLARPAEFVKDLSHLPEASLRRIMGENMARLMNVSEVSV
ncbi:MAG TPA: amidohydrolase family protein [Acidimicrobiales bacterium]|nr:amidohydrolase family protein [Acidimicrobiales bacterium]